MSIWQWAEHFESIPEPSRLTLGEGETPLLRSRSIGPEAALPNLFFKLETTNPSGSYKDRFGLPPSQDRTEGRVSFEYRAWPMHRKPKT